MKTGKKASSVLATRPSTGDKSAKPHDQDDDSRHALHRKPFSDAVLAELARDTEWAQAVAAELVKKAKEGDLRAIVLLRETVEGRASQAHKKPWEEALKPASEDIRGIEERILELLQKSPELLDRLNTARKKPAGPN